MNFHSEKIQPTKDELLQTLNKKLSELKKIQIEEAQNFVGLIRSTLEWTVQYFYKVKYDDIPVWVKGDSIKASFSLSDAIDDIRFSEYFDAFVISDMHNIRKICNEILHKPTASLSIDTARDMLERLEKCIHRIESVLQEKIIFEDSPKGDSFPFDPSADGTVRGGEGVDTLEKEFWALFREKLIENGDPFKLYPHGEYAIIGEEQIGKCSIVAELNLQQKVLNVGLRVDSKSKYSYVDCINCYRKELEAKLKVCVIVAIPKPTYCYCAVMQFPFSSCDKDNFPHVIEGALERIDRYQKLLPEYLVKPIRKYTETFQKPSLKTYQTGDLYRGADFTEMVNNAWGTHYKKIMRCYIKLKNLGYSDSGIAWAVFMDGTIHGPHKGYLWKNEISPDGRTIKEIYVGNNKACMTNHSSLNELRLGFRRDPYRIGNNYECQFVGVFKFKEYQKTDTEFIHIYEKISDRYPF